MTIPPSRKRPARTASTHLREMGTLGGNICQDIRCWYYRNQNNRFPCLRKGGGRCYAIDGDNRYHSIFGGSVEQGCYAVHPSDTAPALIALDATVKTSRRSIKAEDFFQVSIAKTTVLDDDEIVTAITDTQACRQERLHQVRPAKDDRLPHRQLRSQGDQSPRRRSRSQGFASTPFT